LKPVGIVLTILALLGSHQLSAQTVVKSADTERSSSPPGASIYFRDLEDGDVVPKSLRVKFGVTGMKVRRAGNPEENSGHYHLLVDVRRLPPMDQPLSRKEGIYHFDKSEKAAVVNMPPGEHTLQLIFADYRHIPHDPPVMTPRITVTVEEGE
jgi:hypothetical protein